MKGIVAALLLALSPLAVQAAPADGPWFYEFEFGIMLPSSDRLILPGCTKVVPVQLVQWYAENPNPGWEISCGNKQPLFVHALGRECLRRVKRVQFDCLWRHFSSPNDKEEIAADTLAIRGKFGFRFRKPGN